MDERLYREAEEAYEARDYHAAAKVFIAAAGDETEGSGPALHQAGNALLRMERFADAATVYDHALRDDAYDRRADVATNLGMTYRRMGEAEKAVEAYEIALRVPGQPKRYKALEGKAGALCDLGRLEEAVSAYRAAAVEAGNPDPGRSLNNLGLCYMALDRAGEAVEAYRAAVELDSYAGKGKALSNLGVALVRLKRHDEAVAAFGQAIVDHDAELTGPAADAYAVSRSALEERGPEGSAETPGGEQSTESLPTHLDEPESDFFTRTEDDMRRMDKEAREAARTEARPRRLRTTRIVAVVVAIAVVIVGLVAAYVGGLGYPSQSATVGGMLDAYGAGGSVERYWIAVPESDVEKEMAKLPPNHTDWSIDSIDRGATTSTANVTVTLDRGAPLRYLVTLGREGVGWKVTGVENDWRSTGSGP